MKQDTLNNKNVRKCSWGWQRPSTNANIFPNSPDEIVEAEVIERCYNRRLPEAAADL
jgi:hypothetical protein